MDIPASGINQYVGASPDSPAHCTVNSASSFMVGITSTKAGLHLIDCHVKKTGQLRFNLLIADASETVFSGQVTVLNDHLVIGFPVVQTSWAYAYFTGQGKTSEHFHLESCKVVPPA